MLSAGGLLDQPADKWFGASYAGYIDYLLEQQAGSSFDITKMSRTDVEVLTGLDKIRLSLMKERKAMGARDLWVK